MKPILRLVVPCFNESEVLPITSPTFLNKLTELEQAGAISEKSGILFVDDGSSDDTWAVIEKLSEENPHFFGIRLSRNRGHQNALLAGLFEAARVCDVTISIDCDGQDDINAVDEMIKAYSAGYDVVYGVRADRKTDSSFKKFTAEAFYKLMNKLGAEVVFNHADYRLLSKRVLKELDGFKEVNLFLRGLIPLVGFKSTTVKYSREERKAGKTHYSLSKMISLALNGITSLSVKPIRIITSFGLLIAGVSFLGVFWAIVSALSGKTVSGWASMTCILCFVSGVQLTSLGIIGEYVGKIYTEAKARPRYIISDKTYEDKNKEE